MDWKSGFDSVFSDLFSKRRVSLLLFSWLGGLAIFLTYGTLPGRLEPYACTSSSVLGAATGDETGTLVVWRNDVEATALPRYKVTFDNLLAEDGGSGCFRTGWQKVLHIENLRASFFYPAVAEGPGENESLPLADFCTLFAPHGRRDAGQNALGLFRDLQDTGGPWSVSMDLTNAREVRIRRLDWRIHRGDATVFAARCMHACLQAGSPCIILRGHATVIVEGAVLESSCIRLDVEDGRLVIAGRYVLTRGGHRQRGAGACMDMECSPTFRES